MNVSNFKLSSSLELGQVCKLGAPWWICNQFHICRIPSYQEQSSSFNWYSKSKTFPCEDQRVAMCSTSLWSSAHISLHQIENRQVFNGCAMMKLTVLIALPSTSESSFVSVFATSASLWRKQWMFCTFECCTLTHYLLWQQPHRHRDWYSSSNLIKKHEATHYIL